MPDAFTGAGAGALGAPAAPSDAAPGLTPAPRPFGGTKALATPVLRAGAYAARGSGPGMGSGVGAEEKSGGGAGAWPRAALGGE